MTKTLALDIETAPVPDALLSMIIPAFDPEGVKVGNLVDPKKIAAKIEEARASHFEDYKAGAALNAMTGRIVAAGMKSDAGTTILFDDEPVLIKAVWDEIEAKVGHDTHFYKLVGWSITGFDLIFLIKRSYRHKIKPPSWLREGRYWHRGIVDLLDVWKLGEFRKEEGKTVGNSLDNVAKFLGLPLKLGNGKDFAELLRKDPKAAKAYLVRDLEIVEKIAGIIL